MFFPHNSPPPPSFFLSLSPTDSYDSYAPIVRAAGGEVVSLPLRPPLSPTKEEEGEESSSSWLLPPREDLEEAVGHRRTKLVVVNSPHNPTGKVFTRKELELIAGIVQEKHPDGRCLVLLDEVYQHLVHPSTTTKKEKNTDDDAVDNNEEPKHVSLASLPGMAQRCVRVGSAGKTFSLTGFKIGWATSSNPALTSALFRAHQFLTFCCPPALQAGVAAGFTECSSYFLNLGGELAQKRARLEKWARESGFGPLPAEGTYFLVADAAALMRLDEGETDAEFCVRLAEEGGVAAIPLSAFYNNKGRAPKTLVRFCFCKKDEVLDEGGWRLKAFWEKQRK